MNGDTSVTMYLTLPLTRIILVFIMRTSRDHDHVAGDQLERAVRDIISTWIHFVRVYIYIHDLI